MFKILLFVLLSQNLFSQKIIFDTVQRVHNVKILEIKIESYNDFLILNLKNISKKNIYFANLYKSNQELLNGKFETIMIGEYAYEMSDNDTYSLSIFKPSDEIKIKFYPSFTILNEIKKIDLYISFIFRNNKIEYNNNKYLIKKKKYFKKYRKFKYEIKNSR